MNKEIHSIAKLWNFYWPRLNYLNHFIHNRIYWLNFFFGYIWMCFIGYYSGDHCPSTSIVDINMWTIMCDILFFYFLFIHLSASHSFGHFFCIIQLGVLVLLFTIYFGYALLYVCVTQNSQLILFSVWVNRFASPKTLTIHFRWYFS